MTDKNIGTGQRETFAAYVCDELTGQLLSPEVEERSWNPEMIFQGGIAAAVRALGAMQCPEVLIVDISDSSDPRSDMRALAEVCEPDTVVIVLGTVNDVTLFRDLLHAGVLDYLIKPLSSELLREALISADEALSAEEEGIEEDVVGDQQAIIVLSARGGLGASTLAANLAWVKSEKEKQQTILLDMDTYFGTSSLQFDMEPGRGLADAIENPDRVDGLFLERAVVKPTERLAILGSEAPIGSMEQPSLDALERLMVALSENYTVVVADVPRHIVAASPDILTKATDIVIVTDYSLASARDCIRLKAHCENYAAHASIHMVHGMAGRAAEEVEKVDFENSVEMSEGAQLAFDPKSILTASQKGRVLCDAVPSSRLAASIKRVSAQVNQTDESEAASESWFGKLFKKQ